MVTYPSDWTESKLLDHVDLVQGLTYTPENVKPSGTLVLRSSNIQNGALSLLDNVYVNVNVSEEKLVQPGDILVCVRNGSSVLIGKSCILPRLSNTTFGAFMSVLRGDTTGFFAKLFESDIVQEQVRGRSNATINQITKKDFQSIEVTVPSGPEQKDIVQTLGCFDAYVSDLAELIEKKRGIREGALEDLMSGRTRIEGFTEEWGLYHLSDILVPYNGLSGKSGKDFGRGEAKYITYLSVFNLPIVEHAEGLVKVEEKEKQNLVKQGDILFTLSSETLEEVGMASVYMGREDVYLNSFCFGARPKVDLNSIFIAFYLRSHSMREKIIQQGQGSTRYNISSSRLFQIQVNMPNLTEQQAIADTLTAMDEEIEALEIERDKMIQIREGAMDDLLTGRVCLSV